METYNAPSCLLWNRHCDHCGYDDGLNYYEAPNNVIELLTKEQARKKGLIMDCPICNEQMTWWEKKRLGMCMVCEEDKKTSTIKI